MKYNIILHTTTSCNFNCSYCDVIKDNKFLKEKDLDKIIGFVNKNSENINRFKFFGGEPLLAWKSIKYLINNTHDIIGDKFEIVTNTKFLNDEIGEYFQKYFEIIFFSIDSENAFDFKNVFCFIEKFKLKNKVFFNLIISPGKENFAYEQYEKIYSYGLKSFNILPVYYTKEWTKGNLISLSKIMKIILNNNLIDNNFNLYGFQYNKGYNSSLLNESIFIDIDGKIYYSDFVSTYLGNKIKKELYLGKIANCLLSEINISYKKKFLDSYNNKISQNIKGQKELHKIMDYFSIYLNKKNVQSN